MTDKFDEIIRNLNSQQPTLGDADELTDKIMASLPEQESAITPHGPRVLYLIRNITSAAAMFLIALFIWQYYDEPELTYSEFTQTITPSHSSLACNCDTPRECAEKYIAQYKKNAKDRKNAIGTIITKYHENN